VICPHQTDASPLERKKERDLLASVGRVSKFFFKDRRAFSAAARKPSAETPSFKNEKIELDEALLLSPGEGSWDQRLPACEPKTTEIDKKRRKWTFFSVFRPQLLNRQSYGFRPGDSTEAPGLCAFAGLFGIAIGRSVFKKRRFEGIPRKQNFSKSPPSSKKIYFTKLV
jgi:hypothetical protein